MRLLGCHPRQVLLLSDEQCDGRFPPITACSCFAGLTSFLQQHMRREFQYYRSNLELESTIYVCINGSEICTYVCPYLRMHYTYSGRDVIPIIDSSIFLVLWWTGLLCKQCQATTMPTERKLAFLRLPA